jgi:hypothetical protein
VLSIQQKLEIINQLEKRGAVKHIAMQYGIGQQTVCDLKNQKNSLLSDKLILHRLRTDICKKENAVKKQMTILNYFKC